MFSNIAKWTFKPGTRDRQRQFVDSAKSVVQGREGFQRFSSVRVDDNTVITVLVYSDKQHADANRHANTDWARQQLGDALVNAELLAMGEVEDSWG